MESKVDNLSTIGTKSSKVSLSHHVQGLRFAWMFFEEYKEQILELRRKVYVEEQGFDDEVVMSEFDALGLHLGAFDGDKLVSSVSMFVVPHSHANLANLGIDNYSDCLVQFSRRVELPEYRSSDIANLMVAFGIKSVFELFQPAALFASLAGKHRKLKNVYNRMYGFNKMYEQQVDDEIVDVLIVDEIDNLRRLYLQMRNYFLDRRIKRGIKLPDLSHHIFQYPLLSDFYHFHQGSINLYLDPLSLADELPRLSAQARSLFFSLKDFWNRFFKNNLLIKNVIDIGCGPGVYASLLKKMSICSNKNFYGADIDPGFIEYAKFTNPKINWIQSSLYSLDVEPGTFDLVNTSFVFIHLLKPYLALKEIHRILALDGYLVITDVNDNTFQGPDTIKIMVDAHRKLHLGDRRIMDDIDDLAEAVGFSLVDIHSFKVKNDGFEDAPDMNDNVLSLGRWNMWGMFAFMGQRSEIKSLYEEAEATYSSTNPEIEIEIQTKIFKKIKL
jgi:ubiquinone/menaquinone biosynthesis C-methylase UbiE